MGEGEDPGAHYKIPHKLWSILWPDTLDLILHLLDSSFFLTYKLRGKVAFWCHSSNINSKSDNDGSDDEDEDSDDDLFVNPNHQKPTTYVDTDSSEESDDNWWTTTTTTWHLRTFHSQQLLRSRQKQNA